MNNSLYTRKVLWKMKNIFKESFCTFLIKYYITGCLFTEAYCY